MQVLLRHSVKKILRSWPVESRFLLAFYHKDDIIIRTIHKKELYPCYIFSKQRILWVPDWAAVF